MSARRHLHLLLVASLIVILFALVPAKAESAEVKIIEIEHFSAKEENQIEVNVVNNDQQIINCNLGLTIYSIDLMENIPLSDSITFSTLVLMTITHTYFLSIYHYQVNTYSTSHF